MTSISSPPSKHSQEPSHKNALTIEHLSFDYNGTPVFETLNLSLKGGDFAVLFGPNGSGKTTLFKLILGRLSPSSGTLFFPHDTEIGYVPQKTPLDPLFPISTLDVVLQGVLRHTTWWGHLPKTWRVKGEELLHYVGLTPHANKPFGTLSGGQMQRALIARALLAKPTLLLLDEPTAHVDATSEEEIIDLLLQLQGQTTILIITHNLQPLLPHATSLYCLNHTLTPYTKDELCDHFSVGLYPQKRR